MDALTTAIFSENADDVRMALAQGENVNMKIGTYGDSPLHYAARYGLTEIVRILVENGADVNAKTIHSYTPLHGATFNGYIDVMKILLENGADVAIEDRSGEKAQMMTRNPEILSLLEQYEQMEVKDPGYD